VLGEDVLHNIMTLQRPLHQIHITNQQSSSSETKMRYKGGEGARTSVLGDLDVLVEEKHQGGNVLVNVIRGAFVMIDKLSQY